MNRKTLRRQKSLAGKKNRGKRSVGPALQHLLQESFNSHQAGRLEEAEAGYRKILQTDPRHADANHFLGMIAHHFGHFEAAVELIGIAIKEKPGVAAFHFNLGLALQRQEMWDKAGEAFRQALKINPNHSEALSNLGQTLHKLDRLDEAITCFHHSLELKPGHIIALNNLGLCLQDKRQLDDAVEAFRKAIDIDPDFHEAHNNLGNVLEEQGDMEKAHASFRRAIDIKPDFVEAYRHLITSQKNTEYSQEMKAMEGLLARSDLPELEEMQLNFGLAKAYEDLKEFEKSFDFVLEGNRLKRLSYKYATKDNEVYFNRLKETFNASFFDNRKDWGCQDEAPIFILGMPRSGTSLVEQILASHPLVVGAGELMDLSTVCHSHDTIASRVFPDSIIDLEMEEFSRMGADYVDRLRAHSSSASYITDKLPGNFPLLGMIKAILPRARVVHCRRDPIDTCLSIFKNYFLGEHPYAYEMTELGDYHKLYRDLMAHWHGVLPGFVHDIDYEKLVSDPENQIPGLLEACGLPFDEACLSFYKTERPVRTVSVVQVRQPMYKDSVQAWKRYEKQLQPLIAALK
jgi:tetratricopeptide (TPR) repeat protein